MTGRPKATYIKMIKCKRAWMSFSRVPPALETKPFDWEEKFFDSATGEKKQESQKQSQIPKLPFQGPRKET